LPEVNFVRVASVDDIQPGSLKKVRAHRRDILVVNADGNFYACDNLCPHQLYPLVNGELDGEEITCALHSAIFNVNSGEVVVRPPTRSEPLIVYEVRVEGSDILVGPRKG
jgi:nitrite reductase/ring-hydroxylating ferredoxin subunit